MFKLNTKEIVDQIRQRSFRQNIMRFLSLKESSSKIALSIAIGMLVGIIVPMGAQTFVVVPLSLLFKCNPLLSIITTWITNPVTIVPLYFAAYKVGELFLNRSIPWNELELVLKNPTLDKIFSIGIGSIQQIFLGCLVIGIFAAILSYFGVYYIVNYYRKKMGMQTTF